MDMNPPTGILPILPMEEKKIIVITMGGNVVFEDRWTKDVYHVYNILKKIKHDVNFIQLFYGNRLIEKIMKKKEFKEGDVILSVVLLQPSITFHNNCKSPVHHWDELPRGLFY